MEQSNQDENLTIDQIVDPSEEDEINKAKGSCLNTAAAFLVVIFTIFAIIPTVFALKGMTDRSTCVMSDAQIFGIVMFLVPALGMLFAFGLPFQSIRKLAFVVNPIAILLLIISIAVSC